MTCEVFDYEKTKDYKYVVILSQFRGKLLLSQHRERDTWETQGGHIERGETPERAARRELWEESGATEFTLEPVCGYRCTGHGALDGSGAVFYAKVTALGNIPESEMARVRGFDEMPENLTYPDITPVLFERVRERFAKRAEGQP